MYLCLDAIFQMSLMSLFKDLLSILSRDVRQLYCINIIIFKVQLKHRPIEEVRWEVKYDMQSSYP